MTFGDFPAEPLLRILDNCIAYIAQFASWLRPFQGLRGDTTHYAIFGEKSWKAFLGSSFNDFYSLLLLPLVLVSIFTGALRTFAISAFLSAFTELPTSEAFVAQRILSNEVKIAHQRIKSC